MDKYLVYYRKNMYNNFYISTVISFFLKGIFIVLNCASSALICPLTLFDTDVKLQMLMENNLNINQPLR